MWGYREISENDCGGKGYGEGTVGKATKREGGREENGSRRLWREECQEREEDAGRDDYIQSQHTRELINAGTRVS